MQVSHEWPGLPAGVKFDPSDVQLLEHLAAKCGVGNAKPHVLIDEFIPTLEEDKGICYTHPENLPGEATSKPLIFVWFFPSLCSSKYFITGNLMCKKLPIEINYQRMKQHKILLMLQNRKTNNLTTPFPKTPPFRCYIPVVEGLKP